MSSLKSVLAQKFSDAFEKLGYDRSFGLVVDSQRQDLCQFQCNGALSLAKSAQKNPRSIAEDIMKIIDKDNIIESLSMAGPGFINIIVTDDFIAKHCNTLISDDRLGVDKASNPENVVIDFASPNVAKPMHVGHLRSTIIGDSIQKLFKFSGHNTIGDNHIGDWGTQMGMLICELRLRQPNLPWFDENFSGDYPTESPVSISDLEKMYPEASKRCKENEEAMAEAIEATSKLQNGHKGFTDLWKHFAKISIKELKKDFAKLGVTFDTWYGESFYQDRMVKLVEKLKKENIAELSDGALILKVSKPDDKKEIPPLLLAKSDGSFLYATSDLAAIDFRVEKYNVDKIIYVVDQRQSLHFEQLFRGVKISKIAPGNISLVHAGFGTVNGTDGKPFKTRAGGVMKLSDLITLVTNKAIERMNEADIAKDLNEKERMSVATKVGLSALKFADLSNHRTTNYVFDIDKFTQFEGKTGPYLLYTAVRIKSILRKTKDAGIVGGTIITPSDTERPLMLLLSQLPDVIESTMNNLAPNYLCEWVYNISQEFNRFYKNCHILNEQDKQKQSSWLSIVKLVLSEMELALELLGIEIPDKM